MNKQITILGFSGSGKTTYIVSLYNRYHKSMNSKSYHLQLENREEKTALDKLLRELKLKRNISANHPVISVEFSLFEKGDKKSLSNLTISEISAEKVCENPEEYEACINQSDLIVFIIDSCRVANHGMKEIERYKEVFKCLKQDRKRRRKKLLFLFSKYDKVIEINPNRSFQEFSNQYLTSLIQLINDCGIEKFELTALSCFSERDDELNLNDQINLEESFQWIVQKGLRVKEIRQMRTIAFIALPVIVFTMITGFWLNYENSRQLAMEKVLEYDQILTAYELYLYENEFGKENWEMLYEQLKGYKENFGQGKNVFELEEKIIAKLEQLELRTVKVQRGVFIMGSNDDKGVFGDYSKPVHKVEITYDFMMGKYEVTNDEYLTYLNDTDVASDGIYDGKVRIVMTSQERFKILYEDGGFIVSEDSKRKPANNITWWGAVAYCNWLSSKEGLPLAYDNEGNLLDEMGEITDRLSDVKGYRLPSEAEWEYAARGGVKSSGYIYSGSDVLDDVGWYASNNDSDEVVFFEVGQKKPNELGLYDMSGNVEEWCQDCMDLEFYAKSRVKDPIMLFGTHQQECTSRIVRGGASFSDESTCRVSNRFTWGVNESYTGLGFRVVRIFQEE